MTNEELAEECAKSIRDDRWGREHIKKILDTIKKAVEPLQAENKILKRELGRITEHLLNPPTKLVKEGSDE